MAAGRSSVCEFGCPTTVTHASLRPTPLSLQYGQTMVGHTRLRNLEYVQRTPILLNATKA